MTRVVFLDAGPLGMISHRGGVAEIDACQRWVRELLGRGTRIVIPEIADYEIRRELLRARKTRGVERLDALTNSLDYLPVTTAAIRRAAMLWAEIRQRGLPTADPKALDGDVILAAQVLTARQADTGVVVATTNVGHLSRMVPAAPWQEIE